MVGNFCFFSAVSGLSVISPQSLVGIYQWRSVDYGPSAFDHLQYTLASAYPDVSVSCNYLNHVNDTALLAYENGCPPVLISKRIQLAGGVVAIIGTRITEKPTFVHNEVENQIVIPTIYISKQTYKLWKSALDESNVIIRIELGPEGNIDTSTSEIHAIFKLLLIFSVFILSVLILAVIAHDFSIAGFCLWISSNTGLLYMIAFLTLLIIYGHLSDNAIGILTRVYLYVSIVILSVATVWLILIIANWAMGRNFSIRQRRLREIQPLRLYPLLIINWSRSSSQGTEKIVEKLEGEKNQVIIIAPELMVHNESCCICIEDFLEDEEVAVLPCRHGFHELCIQT